MMVLIVIMKMPVWKAVTLTLALVFAIAGQQFDTPAQTLTASMAYGAIKGFWPITVVIFGAIYSYNVMQKTGAIATIRSMLSRVSDDRRILIILISWCFGGFLEAVAGFSTAVAIPLGILLALGFNPVRAAVATLVADTVSTTFGAVGIPLVIMADQLHLPATGVTGLSSLTILQLGALDILIPFAMIFIMTGTVRAFKGVTLFTLVTGIATFVPQWLIAVFLGPELTAFGGAMVSLAVVLVMMRFRRTPTPEEFRVSADDSAQKTQAPSRGELLRAGAIYALMFVFILASSPLFPAVQHALNSVVTAIPFTMANGHVLTAKINWIATPGALIFFATIIGGLAFQKARVADLISLVFTTIRQLWAAGLAISAIVAMATLMDVAGMMNVVAHPLLELAGSTYPFVVPWIGAIGTFITGSVTNSNVLFGHLQTTAAAALHMDPVWLAAANAAGATATKMIAPQSITIAVSSAGLVGMDSTLMKGTLKWALLYLVILTAVIGPMSGYFYL